MASNVRSDSRRVLSIDLQGEKSREAESIYICMPRPGQDRMQYRM